MALYSLSRKAGVVFCDNVGVGGGSGFTPIGLGEVAYKGSGFPVKV